MREMVFRGREKGGTKWFEGDLSYLVHNRQKCYIFPPEGYDSPDRYEVDPATVGQYTGLTDQNDKKVFEGDVVKMHYFFENYAPGTLGAFEDEEVLDVVIKIDKYGVSFETLDHEMSGYLCDYLQDPEAELEIFGNIYDNPELMGGEKK